MDRKPGMFQSWRQVAVLVIWALLLLGSLVGIGVIAYGMWANTAH